MAAPGKEGTVLEVGEVVLVTVGFALEGDVAIGAYEVAVHDEPHEPLKKVPDEKKHEQHFTLLSGVDAFVVVFGRGEPAASENEPADVDGIEGLAEEQSADFYDGHGIGKK